MELEVGKVENRWSFPVMHGESWRKYMREIIEEYGETMGMALVAGCILRWLFLCIERM